MLGLLPFQTSAMVAGASALAALVSLSGARMPLASVPSLAPLFRESLMSLTHFVLGCAVICVAAVALVAVNAARTCLRWLQPGIA